jgi:ATP-dependent Lhr-like helicase
MHPIEQVRSYMVFENLDERIRKWLFEHKEYLEPTVAQKKAVPLILNGKNVLLSAPTGHGKTLSAVLPLFSRMLDEEKKGVRMLYLTPMRALNRDIFRRIVELGNHIWIETDIRHGDTPQRMRTLQTKMPPDCLITTPETLQAILTGSKMKEHLKSVKYVIVDEVHELIESKRGSQLSIALERLGELSGEFQRIGLSATVGDKNVTSKFLVGAERSCEILDINEKKVYDVKVEYSEPTKSDKTFAKEVGMSATAISTLKRIDKIIDSSKNCLIFTNTREMAEVLGSRLKKTFPDKKIEMHHSSLSKEVRISAEDKFKDGKLDAIIATSSLELGIDVGSIDVVVQYNSPRQVTKLMQRVGRAGHSVAGTSKGIVLCTDVDDYLEASAIDKLIHRWIEEPFMPEKPLDVLCNQIIGHCIQERDLTVQELHKMFVRAYPFRNLTLDELESVVKLAIDLNLIYREGDRLIRRRKAFSYFYENLSTIPDEKSYLVIDSELNRKVGILHQAFVVQNVSIGATFMMNAEAWRVNEIRDNKIMVARTGMEGAIPSWEGELIPVAFRIAQDVGRMRGKSKMLKNLEVVPDNKKMVIERTNEYVIIHSCFGSRVNETLSKVLGAMISSEIGTSVGIKTDPYRIIFKLPPLTDNQIVERKLKELKPEWIEEIIKKSMKNSSLFMYRFFHVCRRFGLLTKDAQYNQNRIKYLMDAMDGTPIFEETIKEILTDKLDIDRTKNLIAELNKKIKIVSNDSFSVLGVMGLELGSISAFVQPEEAFLEVMELVKARLLKKRFWFKCTRCSESLGNFTVENMSELKCKCGSKVVGFAPYNRKKEVGNDYYEKTSDLFLAYGKKAVFVSAAYGIGPDTAKRILRTLHKDEKSLLRDIIEAERTFLRTKQYWD